MSEIYAALCRCKKSDKYQVCLSLLASRAIWQFIYVAFLSPGLRTLNFQSCPNGSRPNVKDVLGLLKRFDHSLNNFHWKFQNSKNVELLVFGRLWTRVIAAQSKKTLTFWGRYQKKEPRQIRPGNFFWQIEPKTLVLVTGCKKISLRVQYTNSQVCKITLCE